MSKKVAVLGSGIVGQVLADGFIKNGYDTMRASRDKSKLADWLSSAGEGAHTGDFAEAAEFGDIIVLAVKGSAAESALELCNANKLIDKTIIDTTNPIADEPPENGVIKYFTSPNESLMEKLQNTYPKANFVKAFSCVGNAFMVDPDFDGMKPTMFYCGNNDEAKKEVEEILEKFGWEYEDMGAAEGARAIEPLAMLWCIPGFRSNSWSHAFKLLKK
jgi:predicted dinucleotide-binding enzyme